MTDTFTQTDASFTFKWKIPKFLDRLKSNGDYIRSPEFSVCDSKNTAGKCVLKVFPKDEGADSKDFFALYLINKSEEEISICFEANLVDRSGDIKEGYTEGPRSHEELITISPEGGRGYPNFVKIDELQKKDSTLLSKDGTLTINLDIYKPWPSCPVSLLSRNLEDCFENMEFSDRQIVCQGKKFNCHRFLLSCRSPYFAAMFSSAFKEGSSNEIVIDSIQPDILEEMLYFIYCGKTRNLKDNAIELLKAADHCQLDNLKDVCGYYLSEGLDENNCLDYLVLADKYNEECLKGSVIDFVVKEISSLRQTEKWKKMKNDYPDLMFEVVEKFIEENEI